jgi:predicted GNAT family acetyltransferase
MESFIELIDNYLSNYSSYEEGKVIFECEYGELIFYKNNSNMLILFGIYINSEYRQQGFCRNIFYYLIDNAKKYNFKYFCVQSVLSKILYEYLLRFKYNNKNFNIKRIGFVYTI